MYKRQDIGWGLNEEYGKTIGIDPVAHKKYLYEFFEGSFPGSFARGERYNYNPATLDARTCGTTASLCGIEKGLYEGGEGQVAMGIQRDLMMHAAMMCMAGFPMLSSGCLLYTSLGEKWEFWWFEFMGESTFPPNQLASFPVDQLALSLMEGSLQYAKQGDWVLASSLFRSLHLLACRNANRSPRSVREEQIIRTMEEYIRENLSTVTVGDLCAVFNIQERKMCIRDRCLRRMP